MKNAANISRVQQDDGVHVIAAGEFDLHNGKEFEKALADAAASGQPVTVDFVSTLYIDSAILQYLARYGKAALNQGQRMRILVETGSHPAHVLHEVGFEAFLDIVSIEKPLEEK